jgi:hypothetical protein
MLRDLSGDEDSEDRSRVGPFRSTARSESPLRSRACSLRTASRSRRALILCCVLADCSRVVSRMLLFLPF